MTDKLRVTVTQEDIDEGKPRSCFYCPIARAIRRTLDDPECGVAVSEIGAIVRDAAGRREYVTSRRALHFIKLFDKFGRHAVAPATFILTLD